jgi:hypothetical protein
MQEGPFPSNGRPGPFDPPTPLYALVVWSMTMTSVTSWVLQQELDRSEHDDLI